MTANNTLSNAALPAPTLVGQAPHVRAVPPHERDKLIVSTRKVDGQWVIVSAYGDPVWWLASPTTNSIKAGTKLDFEQIAPAFRHVTKAMMYRLIRRGRDQQKRSGTASIVKTFTTLQPFLAFLEGLKIGSLAEVTSAVCHQYVESCRSSLTKAVSTKRQPLKPSGLYKRFQAVEAVHELSQYSDDPMLRAPWPETSADRLSGYGRAKRDGGTQTPLMPDEVFERLFQHAWAIVQKGERLLDLRDHVNNMKFAAQSEAAVVIRKNEALASLGWEHGLGELRAALFEVRTACYVVVASLSGCRNHELSFLRADACYSTIGSDGERYWWMRSKSTKTGIGDTEWMIPEAAVLALKTMDRWAAPYQAMLQAEIVAVRQKNPRATRIAEAQEHLDAIFIGVDKKQERQVRTLGTRQWNQLLKEFARDCQLDWLLATHQFRRKFANYAARSQFGDLRYLKEHFKHWTLDMTLHYALNEAQELTLYLEIEDELDGIKERVAGTWLEQDEPLAGGYGGRLMNWRSRSETVTLFKSHAHMVTSIAHSTAIRSNGHAFCTADDNLCVGNDLEPTRCAAGCGNAVIDRGHAPIYQRLHDDLVDLTKLQDIGEGGRARVRRDLERCRQVLADLGFTPSIEPT